MEESLLLLGGNLGDVKQNMDTALKSLEAKGVEVTKASSDYVTEPWGFDSDNEFLNRAVLVQTVNSPFELMGLIHEVEEEFGRERSHDGVYRDRPIDIDILLFGEYVVRDEQLEIPHPRMGERLFVLEPAAEIAGDKKVPGRDLTIDQMLADLRAKENVNQVEAE